MFLLKIHDPGWGAQLVGRHPAHQKGAGSIPGQSTQLDCGFDPWSGNVQEATDGYVSLILMSLSLSSVFLSLLPASSLSKINKHILG